MTEKQKRFCKEFLVDLNATQAAIRAGYSQETAGEIGCENLKKPNIQKEIEKLVAKRNEQTGLTAEMVVKELASIGFLPLSDINLQGGVVRASDKVKALELLGKHMGMFTDNVKMTVDLPTIIDDG